MGALLARRIFGMRGRFGGLVVSPQVLVELLARPYADELDRDVPIRLLPGEPDHVVREVDDLDGLAHVEDEDVAALADRPGLDDELHGLRDRHEVALHVRDA